MKARHALMVAILLGLSACSETATTTTAASGSSVEVSSQQAAFMTRNELLATIPGATIYGISSRDNETEWSQTYSACGQRGTIEGLWNGDPYEATWYVDGNQWCEDWGDDSACFDLVRVNETELQAFRNGTEQTRNSWFIR